MARFDPFPAVSCTHGAPMGRHGDSMTTYDGVSKLYARHMGGDGYYDKGGAYWGASPSQGPVWAVWTRGGAWCTYVRAKSREAAIMSVRRSVEE